MSDQVQQGGSCLGCIFWIALFWIFLIGWTYQGTHYDLECSCARGLEVRENVQ